MKNNVKIAFSTLLLGAYLPASAWAQVSIPSAAQPGRVDERLRIDERPAVGGAVVITVPDDAGKQKRLDNKTSFKLSGVKFKNLKAFSEEEIFSEFKDKIGTSITLGTLNGIAEQITARYRNAGYILSRAVIPPQRISGGVVTIEVVEGFVDKVVVQGAPDSGLIAEYADKIRAERPLNAAALERYLLLIEDLPGVAARAVLQPSAKVPGASDVVINVTQKTIDGSVSLDNRGTRYLGPLQGALTANANNLFGIYDHTMLRGLVTPQIKELKFFQISHDEQIGSEGTKLTLSAGRTKTRPGYRLKTFDVEGTDTTYGAEVLHPFIRSRQENMYGSAAFDVRRTDSESLGADLYADRLHVARLGGAYDFVDSFAAVNRFDVQVSKGFGWNDDVQPNIRSRVGAHPTFWKGTLQASRLQNISGPFGVYVATRGQLASNMLLSAEQFGIGGANFGSAYDASEITGDSGIAGRAELQYSRSGDSEYIPAYQLYGFYDIGEVWTRHPSAGQNKTDSIASLGAGVRFNIMEPISGDLEVAVPMTRPVAQNDPNHGNDARVFFSLAYRY